MRVLVNIDKVYETIHSLNDEKLPQLNITILRNITIDPLDAYIQYFAYQSGFLGQIQMGEYDNVMQEALLPTTEIFNHKPDFVLIFLKLETLSSKLTSQFSALSEKDIQEEKSNVLTYINSVLTGIRQKTAAPVIFHLFEMPCYPEMGLYDSQRQDGQSNTIQYLNAEIRAPRKNFSDLYFVDLNLCLMRLGHEKFYDNRFWFIGKQPYSLEAMQEIAFENIKIIRSIKGLTKKCLILDCDNTLWGGILGEDGIDKIQIGNVYPGAAFKAFQQQIINLYRQGIIIAICSKNNPEEVDEVLNHHPEMLLRNEHIAVKVVNWQSKTENIQHIAKILNIGLDHLVFVDDSAFEINLVKEQLPMVSVIQVFHEEPENYSNLLLSCGYFDKLSFSEEDKSRGKFYVDEVKRQKEISNYVTLDDYLKSLKMELEIKDVDLNYLARIAQLTQRTNQFNLTTKRYTEDNIKDFIAGNKSDVLYVKLKDKFGDFGVIGAAIIVYNNGDALIDSFLLSCRALSRGVEDALLCTLIKRAGKKGCKQICAEYIPTKKNKQVEHFYTDRGFSTVDERREGENLIYRYHLDLSLSAKIENKFHGEIR